jgi:opacity protein-like surface antigen
MSGSAAKPGRLCASWSLAIGLCLVAGVAVASDKYRNPDFSLRFPAALTNFSTYGDVAGVGGASVGSRFSSSINPAAAAWPLKRGAPVEYSLSPQFIGISFTEGTRLGVGSVTLSAGREDVGSLQLTVLRGASNRRNERRDLGFYFDTDLVQLQWGRVVVPGRVAVGATLSASGSEVKFGTGDARVARTVASAYTARLGASFKLSERLIAGATAEYAISPAKTTGLDQTTGLFGTVTRDETRQHVGRVGIAYEYAPESNLYLDLHQGRVWNDLGHLSVRRVLAGVEQRLIEGVFARGGLGADLRGPVFTTIGIGAYPVPWFSVDLAYQHNMLPELRPELGKARTITLSVSAAF